MNEIILNIEEVFGQKFENKKRIDSGDGFKVTTNKQEILFLVDDGQNCCESWGQIFMNDNPQDFLNAEILNIDKVDIALDKKKIDDLGSLDQGEVSFLNINTDRGTLQLAVYDSHNGYYGHSVYIRS